MPLWLHIGSAGVLVLGAWLLPRHVAGARAIKWPAAALDIAPVALATLLLLVATGRPLFTGVVLLALGAGLALADWAKRDALKEPVVFSDMSELPQVFTHPQLYLPFAGPGLVIGGAMATIVVAIGLLVLETPLTAPAPFSAVIIALVLCAIGWAVSREPLLSALARVLRRLGPSGDPFADASRLGPFTTLYAFGVIARAERNERRSRHRPAAPAIIEARPGSAGPIVMVQCESFFDARRLAPQLPADLLPGFDACCAAGAAFGRLDVSGWGANTMRTEFAALTGIADCDLGYDRFNPYHAFARVPVASLAWKLRALGYRTLCLHPFDRRFFRRDLTLPALGFDLFRDGANLRTSRRPPYCSDPELARHVLRTLEAEGPQTFVFAITMGNHGPWHGSWHGAGPAIDAGIPRQLDASEVPQSGDLLRYLDGLCRSDEMLQILTEGLERRGDGGILAFYGDHLPSLPRAFRHFGFDEWSTDYVLWPGCARPAQRLDLPAHGLAALVLDRRRSGGGIATAPALAEGAA
ncbi:MAG: LTA synthase family protein [Stellaceae bacterium]